MHSFTFFNFLHNRDDQHGDHIDWSHRINIVFIFAIQFLVIQHTHTPK